MSAAEAMETLATRAREASKSFFIEKVFKLLIRKLLCVLDLKMECDWDIAYPLWRKGTYIFPHCGGEYCVKSRGNTLKNINGRSRRCPRLRKGRSYGVMCGVQWLLWPRGLHPRLQKGRPYGAMRGIQWLLRPRGVHPPATKRSPLRGYAWGLMVIVVPGATPGYEMAAPTGLCVGFNGYCGPGGCTPGYERVAPTGLCVGFNGYCCPGGATPGYEMAAPTGLYVGLNGSCCPGGCTSHPYDVKG